MGMEDYLGDIRKHYITLCRQIEKKVPKDRRAMLADIPAPSGEETPEERAKWATEVSRLLECSLDPDTLADVRQACACVKTNRYSAYHQKYFPEIRRQHPDDEAYLKAVAAFLNGRPRIGKKVEYRDGKLITSMGEEKGCGCFVIRGGWEKPPTTTWCLCCQGTLYSVYRFIFPEKVCRMAIVETHATGGSDCVFSAWYEEPEAFQT